MTTVLDGGVRVAEVDDAGPAVPLPRLRTPRAVPVTTLSEAARDAEFTVFMTQAAPVLGRVALLLSGNVHRAEELVQETLVRTYLAWPRARDGDPVAYSRRILTNLRIDTWRRRRREVLLDPADLPDDGLGDVPSDADGHADRDLLVRALRDLPLQRRRVVVLRYLVGLSEREVATDLGISVGTVKSTAARGLAQLRLALAEPDAGTGTTHGPQDGATP